MTSIRDGKGKMKTNIYFGVVLAAMLVALVPAVTTSHFAKMPDSWSKQLATDIF